MKTLTILQTLGPVDLKNVRRDSLLIWISLLPLGMALIIRIGVPEVARLLHTQWGFDLTPYYPLIMSNFVLLASATVGMVIGFLLLDERDDHMLTALLVTPMPLDGYVLYRISMPMILGLIMTLIGYPIAGLTPISLIDLLAVAALGSITGPLTALFLASFAENKVAGFALAKLLNAVGMVPVAAFFVKSDWQLLAGIVPAYWPLKVFWLAAEGTRYWAYFVAGLVINLVALALLLKRFKMVIHR